MRDGYGENVAKRTVQLRERMARTPQRGHPTVAVGGNPRGKGHHQPGMDPDQGSTNFLESLPLVEPVRVGRTGQRLPSSTGFTRGYRWSAPPGPQLFLSVRN